MPGRKRETGHQMQQEFSQVRAFALTGFSTAQQTTFDSRFEKIEAIQPGGYDVYGPIPLIAAKIRRLFIKNGEKPSSVLSDIALPHQLRQNVL